MCDTFVCIVDGTISIRSLMVDFVYLYLFNFLNLFGVLRRFQHCTGHITMGSWKGRRNQYIQFVRVLYCKLPTNGKQLPAFPLEAVPGIEPRPQRWLYTCISHTYVCTSYYVILVFTHCHLCLAPALIRDGSVLLCLRMENILLKFIDDTSTALLLLNI